MSIFFQLYSTYDVYFWVYVIPLYICQTVHVLCTLIVYCNWLRLSTGLIKAYLLTYLGRLKLAQRYPTSHVTRTPLSWSKGQRSRSSGRFAHRRVGASGGCSGERENMLTVGNCCYAAVASAAEAAGEEESGQAYRGGRPPTVQLVDFILRTDKRTKAETWPACRR